MAGYLVELVLLTLELGNSDRLPLPWALVLAAFVGTHLGAGALLGQWRWLPLPLLLVPVVVAVAAMTENFLWILAIVVLVPAGLILLALGIGGRKLFERRGRPVARRRAQLAAGVGLLVLIVLPLPIAVFDRHRTVRAEDPRPLVIDERTGTIKGVGLRDPAASVRRVFGRAPRWTGEQEVSPLDSDGGNSGTPALPGGPSGRETFFRYPEVSFWLNGGRVWSVEITDRRARTSRGVGVGDSLSLVEDAYPSLHCGEGDAGSDEPIPYPFCTGRMGRRTYMYFSGDYTLPGTPVTGITIFPRPIG